MPEVLFTPSFEKDFKSLDSETQAKIKDLCKNFSEMFSLPNTSGSLRATKTFLG